MRYGKQLPYAYSQLKIQIVSVETESKEKLDESNEKIGDILSTFNTKLNNQITTTEKNIEEVKSSIPNNLNDEWETVKVNANKVPGIKEDIDTIKFILQSQ
jgi:hypothetical protein